MSDSDSEPVYINQSPRQGRRHSRHQDRVRSLLRRAPKSKSESQSDSLPKEDAGEAGSIEPDSAIAQPPQLEVPTPDEAPPGHESTDRPKEDADEASSIEPDSAIAQPPQLDVPPPNKEPPAHESTDRSHESTDRLEKLHELKKYFVEHTFSDLREAFALLVLQEKLKRSATAEVEPSSQSPLLEPEDQPLRALGQENKVFQLSESLPSSSENLLQYGESVSEAPKKKLSVKEIVQNGKKWMSEEVMLAFQKYIENRDDFEGLEYSLEELRYQCFSVESYQKTFHHYNFVVKMNKSSSVDSTFILYFAEVKEIFGNKLYFCCPLESDDDGHCYACKNQGMDDLKHPDEGGYQSDLPPDIGCHWACLCMEEEYDEDDDEYDIPVSRRKVDEEYDEDDASEEDFFDLV